MTHGDESVLELFGILSFMAGGILVLIEIMDRVMNAYGILGMGLLLLVIGMFMVILSSMFDRETPPP